MTRPERYAQVKALRDRGLLLRQIADETGLAKSTVSDLLTDPTGYRARARKNKRHGLCVDCGTQTFNSGSRHVPERCRACRTLHEGDLDVRRAKSKRMTGRIRWTDDEIIALVRRVAVNGRVSQPMWEQARATDPTTMPSFLCAAKRFGTWGELCKRAGVKTVGGTSGPYGARITADECLRWVQRCADDIGRVPSYMVYDAWHRETEGSPSQQTVRNRFGSWMAVVELVAANTQDREAVA